MRATVMYGAGDVRVETVADAHLVEPTDALVVVTRASICGSDLWPYNQREHGENASGWATSSSVSSMPSATTSAW
jgi:threonine dehydrogenase-like Zn-dependent dehydrogenase